MKDQKAHNEEKLQAFDQQDLITVGILILVFFLVYVSISEGHEKEEPKKETGNEWRSPTPEDTVSYEIVPAPPF